MPHHRCCYVGRWGEGDLKDSGTVHKRVNARLTGQEIRKTQALGHHSRTPPGKVSVIQIISELLSAITETIPGLSRESSAIRARSQADGPSLELLTVIS